MAQTQPVATGTHTPVLIVGGGPVGLALALELGWRGVSCLLIEQGSGDIDAPKMNEVNTRSMEFCRRWGIADAVRACPFPADYPMDVVAATRVGSYELGRVPRPARRLQQPGPHSPEHLQVCPQHWFDPILRARAASLPGVQLRYHHRLEHFSQSAHGVTASITDVQSGSRHEITADYLVGCDGAGSAIRKSLGIGWVGKPALSNSMHLFFRCADLLQQLGVAPGTFFTLTDAGGLWANLRVIDPAAGLWRLLFDVPADFDVANIDREAWLRRALAKPVAVEWTRVSHWSRRGVVAERFAEGRVFLAGDAVHQVSPTGALGMNTGLADAVDLGWKLAATLQGWGGAQLLDSYDSERRPACTRNMLMATAYYEGQAQFNTGLTHIDADSAEGERTRASIGPQVMAHVSRVFQTLGLQIGIRYEDSPICISDGTPAPADDPAVYMPLVRAGWRAPHVVLADGRSTLDLFGQGFVLLQLRDQASDDNARNNASNIAALQAAAQSVGMPLQVRALQEPAVHSLYPHALVLVRPDGHVAWCGDALPADCDALLARVRGARSSVLSSSLSSALSSAS